MHLLMTSGHVVLFEIKIQKFNKRLTWTMVSRSDVSGPGSRHERWATLKNMEQRQEERARDTIWYDRLLISNQLLNMGNSQSF